MVTLRGKIKAISGKAFMFATTDMNTTFRLRNEANNDFQGHVTNIFLIHFLFLYSSIEN